MTITFMRSSASTNEVVKGNLNTTSLSQDSQIVLSSTVPHSGNDKEFRRAKANKSRNSKRFNHEKHKSEKNNKTWSPEFRRAKMKQVHEKLTSKVKPHSGFEQGVDSIDFLKKQASELGMTMPSNVWSIIENTVLYVMSLADAQSPAQALSISLLYLKTYYSGSIVQKASEVLKDFFENPSSTSFFDGTVEDEESQIPSNEVTPHSDLERPQWLLNMRQMLTNWRLLRHNPILKKISYLISIMITLGLCNESTFQWDIRGVRAFSIPALDRHFNAFDVIDAGIETFMYFVEGGYSCFITKSFSPMLYSNHTAVWFEKEYNFLISNLENVRTGNLRRIANINETAYDRRLQAATQVADDLVRTSTNTFEKQVFSGRLIALNKAKVAFDSVRTLGGLRVSPYTVVYFGKSGVGKSTLSSIGMVVGLLSNGFEAEDEMMTYLQENDKFFSNYRSFTQGVFLDDLGNTKADFVEGSPCNRIIQLCNNVRSYAPMAEAELKGKIPLDAKFVNITTNVKNLGATTYSNEPVSIARRGDIVVQPFVKKQFCKKSFRGVTGEQLDSEKVRKFYTDPKTKKVNVPIIPDLWEIDVQVVVPVPQEGDLPDVISYEYAMFNKKPMKRVDIYTYLKFMIEQSRKHFENQEAFVENNNNMASKIEMCEETVMPKVLCSCQKCVTPQSGVVGYVLGAACRKVSDQIVNSTVNVYKREGSILEQMATRRLLEFASDLESRPYYSFTNWIPNSWLVHDFAKPIVMYAMRDEVAKTVKQESMAMMTASLFFCYLAIFGSSLWLIAVFILWYRTAILVRAVKERVYAEILERNDAMPEMFKKVRDNQLKYVLAALGGFAALYTLLRVWQGFRNAGKNPQGNLQPASQKEVEERDSEVNPWVAMDSEPVPSTETHSTSTCSQLLDKIYKNAVGLRIPQGKNGEEGNRISGGVFLRSNQMLMPHHMWYDNADTSGTRHDTMKTEIVRGVRKDGSLNKFTTYLSSNQMVHIPGTDYALVWVPSAGSYADITKYLPVDSIPSGLCSMVFKSLKGERIEASANITPGENVGHSQCQFPGAEYNLSIPTFEGLCMGGFVSRGRKTMITGFHLGGKTGESYGVLGKLTQAQAKAASKDLESKPTVVPAKSEGTMKTSLYGKDFFLSSKPHPKSPVNFLEEDNNFRVFGAVTGSVTPHSNVVQSIISDTVTDVTGVSQKWGPPNFKPHWKPWHASLVHSSNPTIGIEGPLMEWAHKDYLTAMISEIDRKPWLKDEIRPLTRMQTVCGIDGKRFIDKMPPQTSVGYPLTGPKSEFMTLLDPEMFEDQQFPVELDQQFWDEVDDMINKWLNGERAYPIFKACLKDEPTPLEKDKVRVFLAASIALQLAVRMYFLPVARILSLFPLLSECAVGINSQGPEWHQAAEHMRKFGPNRILAGDYSKYDLRMPVSATMSAFNIMIEIARYSGNYSDKDISIMEGIATDICYPVVAYNGTLLQFNGTNPSGQNLTVYVNSIVNSLLMRAGLYELAQQNRGNEIADAIVAGKATFRDVVSVLTYGDDVKGSVKEGADWFNHISYATFLEGREMVFTPPDKKSTPTEYMSDDEADFLKRTNRWDEDLQMFIGALDEDSIFKSLHSHLRSKALTLEEQAVANIDGALREWFGHGRDTYEMRRKQMQEIASRHDLVCRELHVSYDERLTAWKDKHFPEDGQDTSTPTVC